MRGSQSIRPTVSTRMHTCTHSAMIVCYLSIRVPDAVLAQRKLYDYPKVRMAGFSFPDKLAPLRLSCIVYLTS